MVMLCSTSHSFFFFFNDTATTEIYTLSLHDALPISPGRRASRSRRAPWRRGRWECPDRGSPEAPPRGRSEEHTSELQSQSNLVCRLLLEKKKKKPQKRSTRSKENITQREEFTTQLMT